jgi:hypothetical protein
MNKPQDPVAAETVQIKEAPAVDLPRLVRLTDVLNAEEAAFVEKVLMNSGGKMRDGAWSEDGQHPLWKRPEELKLVSPVGSYSWIPTTRIVLSVEANADVLAPAGEKTPTKQENE